MEKKFRIYNNNRNNTTDNKANNIDYILFDLFTNWRYEEK